MIVNFSVSTTMNPTCWVAGFTETGALEWETPSWGWDDPSRWANALVSVGDELLAVGGVRYGSDWLGKANYTSSSVWIQARCAWSSRTGAGCSD